MKVQGNSIGGVSKHMAKITAREVSQGAAAAAGALEGSRDRLRTLMSALRARNDAIIRERKAEQEERDRRELQDRFDAAKTAMETGRTRAQDEAVQEAPAAPVSAEPAPRAEKPVSEAPKQETPKAPERTQRPAERPQQRTFDARQPQRPGQDRPLQRGDRPVPGDRTRQGTPYNRTTPPRAGQTGTAALSAASGAGPAAPRSDKARRRLCAQASPACGYHARAREGAREQLRSQ